MTSLTPDDDNSTTAVERPSKRQRYSGSTTVTLNVGGTKFITSLTILICNSTYFESRLSLQWSRDEDNDILPNELFIDEEPEPFRILLRYMRRGRINDEDINTDVLSLAEFLGIERLLTAVKIRWYCNIGKGPILGLAKEEDIATTFDNEHGGIQKAISSGLFPFFLKPNNISAEKDLAVFTISTPIEYDINTHTYSVYEAGTDHQEEEAGGIIGALNGLYANGYTVHKIQSDRANRFQMVMTFSRRRHSQLVQLASDSTSILTPSDEEEVHNRAESGYIKQFALLLEEKVNASEVTIGPDIDNYSSTDNPSPYAITILDGRGPWLEEHGFIEREEEYEELFAGYIKSLLVHHFPEAEGHSNKHMMGRIFSRMVKRQSR